MRVADALRGALGAGVGVVAVGLAAAMVVQGRASAVPLLIPPVGASAVLVFAMPASPLAQPRAVLGGNILSALVGLACAALVREPALAAAAALGLALLLMSLAGCLHPPGGSIALGAALASAGQPVAPLQLLTPVALCSLLLVLAAMLYGRVSGHAYPHRVASPPSRHGTQDAPAASRVGYTLGDLDQALARYGELLDVSREDLDALFREVELQSHRRLHSRILCRDVMSRDVIFVSLGQTSESALAYLQSRELRAAPVVDQEGRVVGMARRAELAAARGRTVAAALDPFAHKVNPDTSIEALLPLLSSGATHEALVVDGERRLIGIITQTDLLAVLYRAHLVEAAAGALGA